MTSSATRHTIQQGPASPALGGWRSGVHATAALLLLAALPVRHAQAMEMELEVSGLRHSEGRVMVGVYTEANWLKAPLLGHSVDASAQKDGRVLIRLTELPEQAGMRLALSVFHDLNGNGKLDSNAFGMPKEPYGFSNNAAASFGPPKFEKAQFEAKQGARIAVQLN